MNKFVIATALVMLAGSAEAKTKTVPTPPTRPAELNGPITAAGAIVGENGVVVKAPPGSNVQVDVDGQDVDIQVSGNGPKTGLATVLPWNWGIFH